VRWLSPWSCRDEFLLGQWERVKKGLHRGLDKAPAALMGAAMVVVDHSDIEIDLQFVDVSTI
jgi:hypothetical protein